MLTEAAVKVAFETGSLFLSLIQKCTLHGRVIGQDGKPVGNANVSLHRRGGLFCWTVAARPP